MLRTRSLAATLLAVSAFCATPSVAQDSIGTTALPYEVLWLLAGRSLDALIAPAAQADGAPRISLRGARGMPLIVLDGQVYSHETMSIEPATIGRLEVLPGPAGAAAWGPRGESGVILLFTRRTGAAGRTRLRLYSGMAAADIEGSFAPARATALLRAPDGRFCVASPAGACEATVDWQAELARVNNHYDTVATRQPLSGDVTAALTAQQAARLYQASLWTGATYDATERHLQRDAAALLSMSLETRAAGLDIAASAALATLPGLLEFVDGSRRTTGFVRASRSFGGRWHADASASLARLARGGALAAETGALFRLSQSPAPADLLARDTLGRLYAVTSLQGPEDENPLQALATIAEEEDASRFDARARLRFDVAPALALEGRIGRSAMRSRLDRSVPVSRFGSSLPASLAGRTRGRTTDWAVRAILRQEWGSVRLTGGLQYQLLDTFDSTGRATATPGGGSGSSVWVRRRDGAVVADVAADYRRVRLEALWRRDDRDDVGDAATAYRVAGRWSPSERLTLRLAHGAMTGLGDLDVLTTLPPLSPLTGIALPRASETELGGEGRWGPLSVWLTLARGARDYVGLAPVPSGQGVGFVERDIGDLAQRTISAGGRIELLRRRSARWTVTLGWSSTRTTLENLAGPPFTQGAGIAVREGARLGDMYGRRFLRSCAELPAPFGDAARCGGADTEFQLNDEGYLVWTGAGNSWRDGITRNLFGTFTTAGTPWGVRLDWGMPIVLRDTACVAAPNPQCPALASRLGAVLPDGQLSAATAIRWRRLEVRALLHAVLGRDVWNRGRHLSYLNAVSRDLDQLGKSVETAKPAGYYWRAGPTDGFGGIGGLYDLLAPNSHFVEDASFARLREVAVSWRLGALGRAGDWTVTLSGRNLLTFTGYRGIDPEVPFFQADGTPDGVDRFQLPPVRTVGLALTAAF